jgi:predicted Zn finger-like uncharacterized protein
MLIVCPNCATSYRVETASLGEPGRSVRCVRCRNVWFASDPSVLPNVAQVQCTELEAGWESACAPDSYPSEPPVMPPEPATVELSPPLSFSDIGSPEAVPEPPQENAQTHMLEWPETLPQGQAPVAVSHPPAPAPVQQDSAELPADAWRGERDASSVRGARRQARQGFRWSVPFLPIAFVVLVTLHGALIGWRAEVVKVAPQTAPLYAAIGLPVNLRGLTFANVTTVTQMHDGVPVLVVEGAIASASSHSVEVPRLRLSVRNSKGHEVYAWTALPERSVLAPRETFVFRSRLASPPPDTRDVVVRFFNRNDLATGIRHAAAQTTSKQ